MPRFAMPSVSSARLCITLTILLIGVCAALASQQAAQQQPRDGSAPDWVRYPGSGRPLTGEEIDAAIAGYWARAADPTIKAQALDYLAPLIHSGRITADSPGVLPLLTTLASQGTDDQVRKGSIVANDYPVLRARAVELLGQIGGPDALGSVRQICLTDPSPDVRAAAVLAVVRLSPTPSLKEIAVLRELLASNNARWRDDRLAIATLDAIATVYSAARRPEVPGIKDPVYTAPDLRDPALFQAVAEVALGSYATQVRARALEVMNLIRDARNR